MNENLDILTMNLVEAWNMYKILSKHDETYNKVRKGIVIKFDINDYLKGRILTKPKVGKALVRGKAYPLEQFETELEDREKLLKNWLLDNYVEDKLVKARGED